MGTRQSARMSKITKDGLTRSSTGRFILAVPIWQQWASKGQQKSRLYFPRSGSGRGITGGNCIRI